MGYDLHITRKENWFDEDESNEIKLADWKDYLSSDDEMKLDNQALASTKNEDVLSYISEGLAVWTAYSKNGVDGNFAWFDLRAGNITVKNPNKEIINKMLDVATRINARVQGDDGETYSSDSDTKDKRPWWKFWS